MHACLATKLGSLVQLKSKNETRCAVLFLCFYAAWMVLVYHMYASFSLLSLTQHLYITYASVYCCGCLLFLLSTKYPYLRCITAIGLLFSDVVLRTVLSSVPMLELNVPRISFSHYEACQLFSVRLIFFLLVWAYARFLMNKGRFIRMATGALLLLAAFLQTAVQIPSMLGEALYSHRIGMLSVPCGTAAACKNSPDYIVFPGTCASDTASYVPYVQRANGEHFPLDQWNKDASLLGWQLHGDSNTCHMVVDWTPENVDSAALHFLRYEGPRLVSDIHHVCPRALVPGGLSNCLSADARYVALNNAQFLDFNTAQQTTAKVTDATRQLHFVEWTAADPSWALYYDEEQNAVCFLDAFTREQANSHCLTLKDPYPESLALSPDGKRLLYARKFSDYLFVDEIGTNKMQRCRLARAHALAIPYRPFWVNNTQVVYITQARSLLLMDVEKRTYRTLSQLFSAVILSDYEPAANRLLWTVRTPKDQTTIHALTL